MHERTRMFRALASLIFAMTACAALLTWMAPADPASVALNDPEFPRVQAHEAVALDREVKAMDWDEIELVLPFSAPQGDATSLVATRSRGFHFLVSPGGAVRSASAWKRQIRGDRSTAAILVAVSPAAGAEGMPVSQWIGLRALLGELLDRSALATDLRVRIGPSILDGSSRWARSLRTCLIHDGFLPPSES